MRSRDVLGSRGPFATTVSSYEVREEQLRYADAVEVVAAHDGVLLAEAGTGTGKTFGYLVPAILSGRRVIVSTATKALQDQIMERDIPRIREALGTMGVEFSAACLKGLSNYVCMRRFDEFLRSPDVDALDEMGRRRLPMLLEWRGTTRTGDRSELAAFAENEDLFMHIASGASTRIGPKCTYYDACFVTKARETAAAADVVVVNHHLYFADLRARAEGAPGFLPDHDVVIFDEAHHLEEVCSEFFGSRISTSELEAFARETERASLDQPDVSRLAQGVVRSGITMFAELAPLAAEGTRASLEPEDWTSERVTSAHAFDAALEAFALTAKRYAGAAYEETVPGAAALMVFAARAQRLRQSLDFVMEATRNRAAAWVERRGRTLVLGANLVDVGGVFREHVLGGTRAVVLTSATLTVDDSFAFLRSRLGIQGEVDELAVASPFDFVEQAALFCAREAPNPSEGTHIDYVIGSVLDLVRASGGSAFVLCTSMRNVRAVGQALIDARIPSPVLVQGTGPKHALLDAFRESGEAVLVGTASFWEGVDVPGDALRLVIIDKLPFDVPTDPLVRARCERIGEAGKDPFQEYILPSAVITLRQGFGRLVRSRSDRGLVAVLDPRISSKQYGKVFLSSLPVARRLHTLADAMTFVRASRSGPASSPAASPASGPASSPAVTLPASGVLFPGDGSAAAFTSLSASTR